MGFFHKTMRDKISWKNCQHPDCKQQNESFLCCCCNLEYFFQDPTKIIDAVLEISEPQLDGNKLSYKVKVLLGDLPTDGGELSLFIDSSDAACDVDTSYDGEPCWAQKAFNDPR